MTIKIDKVSLRKSIRDARFPKDMNISDIEKSVERDMIAALKSRGITNGVFEASLGDMNYDITIDSHGHRHIKRLKKQ
jgi:hypothetical protein